MAQIDLKRVTIYLADGFSGAAAVNNGAGYSTSAVTMAIDGYTGVIGNGVTFTVTGSTKVHTITAHSETSGNTTSITFTPGLTGAVLDNAVITLGSRRIEIKVGEGTLTYSEKRNMEYKKDRGLLDLVREGDEEPMDVKLDLQWEWLKSASGDTFPTPEEVLKFEGAASGWTSTDDDVCAPKSINIYTVYTPDCDDVDSETVLLKDYRWETIDHDFKAGTLSTSGKCNVTRAILDRVDADEA